MQHCIKCGIFESGMRVNQMRKRSNCEQLEIQNVFAATDPRQRSTPIQEAIFKLQCQHYEDDLSL